VDPNSAVPSIGASGAIAAVLGGYLVLYPRARVLTLVFVLFFFTFLQLPAMLFLVIWFAEQVLFGLANLSDPTGGGGGVAYFAHIGGFLFGALAIRLFATRVKRDYLQPKYPVY
jgi:membrane associated rhomboid family serine protease